MKNNISKLISFVVCPLTILIALFTLGNLVGQAVYSEFALVYSDVDILVILAGIIASVYFYKALRKLSVTNKD